MGLLFKNKRAQERDTTQLDRYHKGLFGKRVIETKTQNNIINEQKIQTIMEKKFINLAEVQPETVTGLIRLQETGLNLSAIIANLEGVKGAEEVKDKYISLLNLNADLQIELLTSETVKKVDAVQPELPLVNKEEKKEPPVITHPETKKHEEKKQEENKSKNVQNQPKAAAPTTPQPGASNSQTVKENTDSTKAPVKEEPVKKEVIPAEPTADQKKLIQEADQKIEDMIISILDKEGKVQGKDMKAVAEFIQKCYPADHIVNNKEKGIGNAYHHAKVVIAEISANLGIGAEETAPVVEATSVETVNTDEVKAEEVVDTTVVVDAETSITKESEEITEQVTAEATAEVGEVKDAEYTDEELEKIVKGEETPEQIALREAANVPGDTYIPTAEDMQKVIVDYSGLQTDLAGVKKLDDIEPIVLKYADIIPNGKEKYEAKKTIVKVIQKKRNSTPNGVTVFGNNKSLEEFVGKVVNKVLDQTEKKAV